MGRWGRRLFNFIRSLRYESIRLVFARSYYFPNFDISSSTLFLDQMADRAKELLVPPQMLERFVPRESVFTNIT